MPDDKDKTEKPTPRRLRMARKEGQFARTQDAATWTAILAGTAMFPHAAGVLSDEVRTGLRRLPDVAADPSPAVALKMLASVPQDVLWAAGPVCLAAVGAAVLATAVQGVHPTTKTLTLKFNRLNPKNGLKRMFGTRAAWEGLKSLTKVAIIAIVVASLAKSLIPSLLGGPMSVSAVIARTRTGLQTLVWAAAVTGLVLALADYAYQRRTVMKQLRMTPREIKDESKQTEGDPQLKGAIRSRQLAISRNRMLTAVSNADVVLVNPTHYAVALKYEAARGAPRVVARGAGALALKIRERARAHRVPVVEDKPLARTLYRVCEVGEEIPTELYLAVARILAFVMAAGRPSTKAGASRAPGATGGLPELPSKSALRARRSRQSREARRWSRGR